MKRLALVLAAGCSGTVEHPSPNPPPPWGTPISGGTMLVTRDGARAVIADPDRDRLLSIELAGDRVTADVALPAGSDPGRLVEDGAGRIHVALRGSGLLLTIEAATAITHTQRFACAEPRGLAWDSATDLVHVACASGELVSFPAADGDPVRSLQLDRDLRDVIVSGTQLVVTRFRTAEVITLDAQGAVLARMTPPVVQRRKDPFDQQAILVDANATVAWRTIALPDGRILMSHQRKVERDLDTRPGGYGQSCGGPIESGLTVVGAGGVMTSSAPMAPAALPVDVAVSADGTTIALATAGTNMLHVFATTSLALPDDGECTSQQAVRPINDELGIPTSIAFRPNGDLVAFYPELPALVVHSNITNNVTASERTILLPGDLGYDAGRALFHRQTMAGLACASCHPEGRDDGQVWRFADLGARRTQSLAGGILARGPYHWSGDMTDLPALMDDVFASRMAGGELTRSEKLSLGPWLDRLRAPAPSTLGDAAAIARGQTLFQSAELGCITCHTGPLYTNNTIVDVGTGGAFKVPSLLGVGARAPFMHDGCAATLRDRFGLCGGGELHGRTSVLVESQVADLIAFLESL